eukprot:TRINITY_DN50019_c0_g1_i1.p1 TRINITY_DN50019_c0_g1~~TRINITY_DN50019_c0_g1_i1.p1  ORF type:complete len:751 (+),score=222.24 TRINITY_DN50019_c0_g1_i1:74-2254(+)
MPLALYGSLWGTCSGGFAAQTPLPPCDSKLELPEGFVPLQIDFGLKHTVILGDQGAARGKVLEASRRRGGLSEIALPEPAVCIACGATFTLALLQSGDVYSWGADPERGQLGRDADDPASPGKVTLPKGLPAVRIAAGSDFAMVVTSDDTVFSWGHAVGKFFGQLARPAEDIEARRTPGRAHLSQTPVVDLQLGWAHGAALLITGSVVVWGAFYAPEEGGTDDQTYDETYRPDGRRIRQHVSLEVPQEVILTHAQLPIIGLVAGGAHMLALDSARRLWTWGISRNGCCGQGDGHTQRARDHSYVILNAPQRVEIGGSDEEVVAVQASQKNSFAKTASGWYLTGARNEVYPLGGDPTQDTTRDWAYFNKLPVAQGDDACDFMVFSSARALHALYATGECAEHLARGGAELAQRAPKKKQGAALPNAAPGALYAALRREHSAPAENPMQLAVAVHTFCGAAGSLPEADPIDMGRLRLELLAVLRKYPPQQHRLPQGSLSDGTFRCSAAAAAVVTAGPADSAKCTTVAGQRLDLCALANLALAEGRAELLAPIMPVLRALEHFTAPGRSAGALPEVSWQLAKENALYRGSWVASADRAWFTPGKKFKQPRWLPTHHKLKSVWNALRLCREADGKYPKGRSPVLWTIHLDPEKHCPSVAFIERDYMYRREGAPRPPSEFHFLPDCVFTVRSVEWVAKGDKKTWMHPNKIELEASPTGGEGGADLPLAPCG